MGLATADNCPACGVSLLAEPIPEERRQDYGGATHYRRVIAVEYEGGYDGVSEWRCPECEYREDRFTGKPL